MEDDPKAARACFTDAITALSAAQAISRLRGALAAGTFVPSIGGEGSRLLARLSQTLRNPSAWKFARRTAEAYAIGRHALVAVRGSAQADKIKALNGIIVGAQTLGADLARARMILQENSDARRL